MKQTKKQTKPILVKDVKPNDDSMKVPSKPCTITDTNNDFITEQSKCVPYDLIILLRNNVSRMESITKLNDLICDFPTSVDIEKGVFEHSLVYVKTNNINKKLVSSVYNYKISSLIRTMKLNEELISDIKNFIIKPRMLAFFQPSQLYPKNWKTILAKQQLTQEKQNTLPTTDMYKCRKCGMKKCTVSFLQTRSIDEPMTIFVCCVSCKAVWTV